MGDKKNPLSKGKICKKPVNYPAYLKHPDRLKHPVKKSKGKWKQISWDEALDIVAKRLDEIRKRFGSEAVAIFKGAAGHSSFFIRRFANVFGTPNITGAGGAQCFFPRYYSRKTTYGGFLASDYYSEKNYPNCILVWGHNPLVSNAEGEIGWRLLDALNKGADLIVIDPQRTATVARSDIWAQIRSGSDDALALSILNVIIQEDLYDEEFVEKWIYGFEELENHVKDYPPEWTEEITWVSAAKIRKIARKFAETKPSVLETGVALEHTPNSYQTLRAISLLPALTGNIDIPGGWVFGNSSIIKSNDLSDKLPEAKGKKRLGSDRFLFSSSKVGTPEAHLPTLIKAMRTGNPYPIKSILLMGSNSLVGFANPKELYKTIDEVDFVVAADLFMTPTTELADIVLPAAGWLEVDAVASFPLGAEQFVLAEKKITETGECKYDGEMLIELSHRLNLEENASSPTEIFDRQLKPLGITLKELKDKNYIKLPRKYGRYKEKGFDTPSGKIEAYSKKLDQLGYEPLPTYREPPESPFSTQELLEKYPLVLTTGGRVQEFFHSEQRQSSLRKEHPDPLVEIHPKTADERDIEEGEWVYIVNKEVKSNKKRKLERVFIRK